MPHQFLSFSSQKKLNKIRYRIIFLFSDAFGPLERLKILTNDNLNNNLLINWKWNKFELLSEFSSSCHLFERLQKSVSPVGKKFWWSQYFYLVFSLFSRLLGKYAVVFYKFSFPMIYLNPHTPDRFTPHTPVARKLRISADSSLIRQKMGTLFI